MRASLPGMTAPLPERISANLPPFDGGGAATAFETPDRDFEAGWPEGFLKGVMDASPYLGRLMVRRGPTLKALTSQSPEALCAGANAQARAAGLAASETEAMQALRAAKMDIHLVTALADLGGAWSLRKTTAALSAFADAALQGALAFAARDLALAGAGGEVPGFAVLALGKLGTQSLNYSSDIDLVVVWEADRFPVPEGKEPQKLATRLTQRLVRLMSEMTADGYVFRTDLRLRPDPSSTPLAVNGDMARHYFEAVGQNWERAAYAKARAVAGDIEAGNAFIADLEPFIWRRTLDFAAVEDIRALAKQIQAVGNRAVLNVAGHNIKLGLGGIREVEFYAQVLQLVFGGRKSEVRVAGTLSALEALAGAQLVDAQTADTLAGAYTFLRHVEHRIQMLDDEQTQTLPEDDARRARVAALAGFGTLEAFDTAVRETLKAVHNAFTEQFEEGESLATHEGSLVLTGVEPTPDTLSTLTRLGFSDPVRIWHQLSGWAAGRARAARTERARRLFSRLAPRLVEAIGATGDPDATFNRFAAFFEGLPSGVQPLSLLTAHPALADELIAILGLAPRLADEIGKRPALLDVMLEPEFAAPLSQTGPVSREALDDRLSRGVSFEDAMNTARRFVREERLRIGAQLLRGRASASEAAHAYSVLAGHSVSSMAKAAEREMTRRHGPAPGQWHVLGMGKLGGGELSADSDLDLIVVYEPQGDHSAGTQPLETPVWFTRFAQRLVSALSAPTEEGALYPVDLALRPSGSAGPVAVALKRFETYYREEAWVWERMAMTRASLVASSGEGELVRAAIEGAVNGHTLSEAEICEAARDMRTRLERDKPAASSWDLKLREGGLLDIEFVAQAGLVANRLGGEPATRKALERLEEMGWLAAADARQLSAAHTLYEAVTQLTRLAHGSGFDPREASEPFARRLAQAAGCASLEMLKDRVEEAAARTRSIFVGRIGEMSGRRDG